jgi:hypothetical protein
MDPEPTNRGGPPADDPDAIRAAMAETRAALTGKLDTLRERLLGPGQLAPNHGEQAMAKKKTATKKAAKKGAVKKKVAKAKPKAAAARKTAKSASRKSAAKKTAVSKVKAKAPAKKALAKKTTTTSKIVQKAKEAVGDILMGAAAGALHGAADVVAAKAEETATTAEHAAPAPPVSSDPAPSETHTHTHTSM